MQHKSYKAENMVGVPQHIEFEDVFDPTALSSI
jgi:hypothetical protein